MFCDLLRVARATRHRRPEIKSKPTYAEGRGHASLDVQVRVLRSSVIGVDAELLVERLLVEDDHDVVREARRDLHHTAGVGGVSLGGLQQLRGLGLQLLELLRARPQHGQELISLPHQQLLLDEE